MKNKVCMVTGVGEGNGRSISKRFSKEGYRVAMLARNKERLDQFEQEINGAKGFVCDVTNEDSMRAAVHQIRKDLGPIDVFVHNAGSGIFGDFQSVTVTDMEDAWRTNTLGLLVLGQEAVEDMLASGGGNIVVIGATSALRGGAGFAAFAAAKSAQRSLAQSMARSLGPKGIHVSYLVIDGIIDIPRARAMEFTKGMPDDAFLQPDEIADSVWFLTQQPKSTWTFELDIRPYREKW
ncbi:MAG: SDR family NAD(P)-dependent oxidoreductase [Gammaproteobacteria bacterium]